MVREEVVTEMTWTGLYGGKHFLAEGPAMWTCGAALHGRSWKGRGRGAEDGAGMRWGGRGGAGLWRASWPAPMLPSLRGALGSPCRALRKGLWEWIGGKEPPQSSERVTRVAPVPVVPWTWREVGRAEDSLMGTSEDRMATQLLACVLELRGAPGHEGGRPGLEPGS